VDEIKNVLENEKEYKIYPEKLMTANPWLIVVSVVYFVISVAILFMEGIKIELMIITLVAWVFVGYFVVKDIKRNRIITVNDTKIIIGGRTEINISNIQRMTIEYNYLRVKSCPSSWFEKLITLYMEENKRFDIKIESYKQEELKLLLNYIVTKNQNIQFHTDIKEILM